MASEHELAFPFEPGESPPPLLARPILGVAASLFAAAVRLRRAAYDAKLLPRTRVSRPVISVGNISMGGSGKTPFVILLAKRLESEGLRVAVLSRGYGGTASKRGGAPVVVSNGRTAAECGEEPILIAKKSRALVVVASDRAKAAQMAIKELGADVLLLDDGFQHLRLERDLDLVLIDAGRPVFEGRLLPLGGLREPLSVLERADLVILNRGFATHDGSPLPNFGAGRTVEVAVVPVGLVPAQGSDSATSPPSALVGKRAALIAAISRPRRFVEAVRALGAEVVHAELFRDHAWLSKADVDAFAGRARARGAELLLTTEKDAARFPEGTGAELFALAIEQRVIAGQTALDAALARAVEPVRRHAG